MAELIVKTSSAVAVTDELTTIIDWVNIELFSGFTIVVANAGGGSADDLTDVQIDTSNDGGVTSSLDQHAGVPAVPIALGLASQGTFTETAAFIRVRALCANGDDTTANAHILADSTTARICTLADVKGRLGLTLTDNDSLLNRIILGIEEIFNNETRRHLIVNAADVTEYYTGTGPHLQLNRYPVVSITSIKEALDYDFTNADVLVLNTDYRIIAGGKNGIIYCPYGIWSSVEDSIEIIYRGGYCSAGQIPGEGEISLPADLREAAIEEVSFIFKRKDDIGLSSVSFEGGSFGSFSSIELLPMVKAVLQRYRRPSL
jgi:hypothetical protein